VRAAAQEIGIDRLTLTAYEKGERSPRVDDLARMASLYQRSIEWFLRRPEEVDQASLLDEFVERSKELNCELSSGDRAFDFSALRRLFAARSYREIPDIARRVQSDRIVAPDLSMLMHSEVRILGAEDAHRLDGLIQSHMDQIC